MAQPSVESNITKLKLKALFWQVFGWVIAIICGFFATVGGFTSETKTTTDYVMVSIFSVFTAIGVLLIIRGARIKSLIRRYRDYSARLSSDPEKSIDLLASSIGAAVVKVQKDIAAMTALGLFPGAFLDTKTNRLVTKFANQAGAPGYVPAVRYVTVQCRGCGATNKIIAGSVGECEYCGSQISEDNKQPEEREE